MTFTGDWGSLITRIMAIQHPEACVGIHLNFLVAGLPSPLSEPITTIRFATGYFANTLRLELGKKWVMGSESGFSKIQGTLAFLSSCPPHLLTCAC